MLYWLNRIFLLPLRRLGDQSLVFENRRLSQEVGRLEHEISMHELSLKRFAALHEMNMEFIEANRAWFSRQSAELTQGISRMEQPQA
jgi:hypothetical protein